MLLLRAAFGTPPMRLIVYGVVKVKSAKGRGVCRMPCNSKNSSASVWQYGTNYRGKPLHYPTIRRIEGTAAWPIPAGFPSRDSLTPLRLPPPLSPVAALAGIAHTAPASCAPSPGSGLTTRRRPAVALYTTHDLLQERRLHAAEQFRIQIGWRLRAFLAYAVGQPAAHHGIQLSRLATVQEPATGSVPAAMGRRTPQ